jgi:adenylate cyclase
MRKLFAGVAIGIGSAAVVLLTGWSGWLATAELKTYDWRMRTMADIRLARGAQLVHPDIALVAINDASIRDLEGLVGGRWPWPRVFHTLAISFLKRGGAKVIVFDVAFTEQEREASYPLLGEQWTGARSDAALAASVAEAGNVVMLADAVDPGVAGAEIEPTPWNAPPYRLSAAIEERPVVHLPYPKLAAAVASFGHNVVFMDTDGPARRILPFVRQGDRYMPSLGVAAALAYGGYTPDQVTLAGHELLIGDRRIPLLSASVGEANDPRRRHTQQTMLINFRAPGHIKGVSPYPFYGVSDLLKSEGQILSGEKPDLDPAVFRNKIVFIGLTGSGLLDVFSTPFGEVPLPGIQLHASVADSILSNRFIRQAPAWLGTAATIVAAIAIGLVSASLSFWVAASCTVVLLLGWTAGALAAFDRGLWLPMVLPISATALALFAGTAYRYFVEDAEKRKVSRLFGRYVSRDVYKQLMGNPNLAELGGARREMSVLFSDLRGFTTITEKGNPEDLVQQLNEYFTRMVDIVFRNGGTVDKFVGDMVMALFGAPVDDVDHADAAVQAAVEMVRELGELNRHWAASGRVQLDIGVGINSGDMIAGNIGSSAIMSYTVIGDNVNLGSRLESLNKEYRTRIIISEATRARLKKPHEVRPLGGVVVKGKTRPVDIFEVIAPSPLVAEPVVDAAGAKDTHI